MNDNTKIEVSREIMNAMIASYCKKGLTTKDLEFQKLLKEEEEMNKFNFEVIDKILNVYGPIIKRGNI